MDASEVGQARDFLGITTRFLQTGLGPIPLVCRPGVAIRQPRGRVACIIPHEPEVVGCKRQGCYCCRNTCFYSLLSYSDSVDRHDVLPYNQLLSDLVIKPGTMLKLRKSCEALQTFCRDNNLTMTHDDEKYIQVCMATPSTIHALDGIVVVCVEKTTYERIKQYSFLDVHPQDLRHAEERDVETICSRLLERPPPLQSQESP